MLSSIADSPDAPSSATLQRFEMDDASLRQGVAYALGYAVFVLALTGGAVWVWPRLGPWIWSYI